jgi:hypothetical protein
MEPLSHDESTNQQAGATGTTHWSVRPSTFANTCALGNERALDWSDNRHVAFGARTSVVIVEQDPMRVVQTVDEHRFNVCCLKW